MGIMRLRREITFLVSVNICLIKVQYHSINRVSAPRSDNLVKEARVSSREREKRQEPTSSSEYTLSNRSVFCCKFKLRFCFRICIISDISFLFKDLSLSNIFIFSQSNSYRDTTLCLVIIECCLIFLYMWFLCSGILVFNNHLVCPTYEASQSLQLI